ncbi:MAG: hypothetical protein QXL57_00335 [Candidatus Bathyarchaeia archaeon]
MIANKVKKRHLLLFSFLMVGLILFLIGIALFRSEQNPAPEEFRLIFYLSILGTVIFAVLLVVGIMYLGRLRILSKRNETKHFLFS